MLIFIDHMILSIEGKSRLLPQQLTLLGFVGLTTLQRFPVQQWPPICMSMLSLLPDTVDTDLRRVLYPYKLHHI